MTHSSHTHVDGECRLPGTRIAHGRSRGSGPVRDPAVPASGEPRGRRRLTGPDLDGDPNVPQGAGPLAPYPREESSGPASGSGGGDAPYSPMSPGSAPPTPLGAEAPGPEAPATPPPEEEGVDADEGSAEARARRPRRRKDEIAIQAGDGDKEDWRTFDIHRHMRTLRSPDVEVRRNGLRRLHVRWYHATVQQMTQILTAAGVPPHVVAEVAGVVQGCLVCREWKKPPLRNIASFRLTNNFNEEVQFDLLFYHSRMTGGGHQATPDTKVIVHLVCSCIRWSAGCVVPNKEEETLMTAISRIWISIYGPMETLVMDEETGMRGRCVMDWAEANTVGLKYKAPRQKAWIVERHNELIRHGLHLSLIHI